VGSSTSGSDRTVVVVAERIQGSFSTPDGLWRVQAIRERGRFWYRLWHVDRVYQDQLVIGTVEYFLTLNGVDWADLVED
jgi:hypothetical protein